MPRHTLTPKETMTELTIGTRVRLGNLPVLGTVVGVYPGISYCHVRWDDSPSHCAEEIATLTLVARA